MQNNIMYFFIAVGALLLGYIFYGSYIDRLFGADKNRKTPALTMADGVDYVKMHPLKIALIQLLNIAGVGPVFGPILGALYGPIAIVYIVLGSVFGGAVQDYLAGMMSVRANGANMATVTVDNLGNKFKYPVNIIIIMLLVIVGAVFVISPAALLKDLTGISATYWIVLIFAYYFCATILPINKIIGTIYPFFGLLLLIMSVGLTTMLFLGDYTFFPSFPEFGNWSAWTDIDTWMGLHPQNFSIWPLLFVTISCGAISGFHSTQSPLMARCMGNEKFGKPIFYGSMILEAFIAILWVTIGLTFYQSPDALQAAIAEGTPSKVVHDASVAMLGSVGGIFAVLAVIVLPISTGDTALRAARLTIAEIFHVEQKSMRKRLFIAVPLFAVVVSMTVGDFTTLWQYLGVLNQSLAIIMFWAGAMYLYKHDKCHYVASIPAVFMTLVVVAFLGSQTMGFGLPIDIATYIAIMVAIACIVCFFVYRRKNNDTTVKTDVTPI